MEDRPAPEETVTLAKVIAPFDGVYTSRMRNESTHLVESVAEAINLGCVAGVRTDSSHHKAVGRSNWGKTKLTLEMIHKMTDPSGKLPWCLNSGR